MASYANQVSFVKNRYMLIGTIIKANVPSISHSGIDISPITIIIKLSSFCLILFSSLSFLSGRSFQTDRIVLYKFSNMLIIVSTLISPVSLIVSITV